MKGQDWEQAISVLILALLPTFSMTLCKLQGLRFFTGFTFEGLSGSCLW